MAYKFEQLDVWERALNYIDQIHDIAEDLPKHERYNLSEQMTRAANSIALNVAFRPPSGYFLALLRAQRGSTGLSDTEQDRFLRIAVQSLSDIRR